MEPYQLGAKRAMGRLVLHRARPDRSVKIQRFHTQPAGGLHAGGTVGFQKGTGGTRFNTLKPTQFLSMMQHTLDQIQK